MGLIFINYSNIYKFKMRIKPILAKVFYNLSQIMYFVVKSVVYKFTDVHAVPLTGCDVPPSATCSRYDLQRMD